MFPQTGSNSLFCNRIVMCDRRKCILKGQLPPFVMDYDAQVTASIESLSALLRSLALTTK